MHTSITDRIKKAIHQLAATEPCPDIRWDDVIRIEALGTDAIGPFEITVTFVYADEGETSLFVHHKGYDEIIDSLPRRFPSISPSWQDELAKQPWHVERTLYSRKA
jgi:hypothetical protein